MGEEIFALINAFFSFFTDKSRKGVHKIFLAFSVFVFVGFINEFTGCSFYLENHFKLSQVERINKMLADSTLPKDIRSNLVTLRHETIYRLSKIDKLKKVCLSFLQQGSSSSSNENKQGLNLEAVKSRDSLIQFITGASAIILVMIVGFFYELLTKAARSKEPNTLKRVLGLFGTEFILLVIAFSQVLLLSLIPILWGQVWVNYFINIILNIIELGILVYVANKSEKKSITTKKT